MRNSDVEQLFAMVAVGDAVDLHGERSPELAQIFGPVLMTQTAAPAGR